MASSSQTSHTEESSVEWLTVLVSGSQCSQLIPSAPAIEIRQFDPLEDAGKPHALSISRDWILNEMV